MKGIVFTEFLEMVEDKFGLETVDYIIEESTLESKGIYTAVGTYSHFEMVELVTNLSDKIKVPVDKLLYTYALHFFDVLLKSYPQFFEKQHSAFEFLKSLDDYIHPQVLKLYPDAELPKFQVEKSTDDRLHLIYTSSRKMSDFAEGLMQGVINHFNEKINLSVELIKEDKSEVRFILVKA